MSRCEDFPCCGHELGCCPDYDPDTGQQLNMICTCGAKLPINNRYSICSACMAQGDSEDGPDWHDFVEEDNSDPSGYYTDPDL